MRGFIPNKKKNPIHMSVFKRSLPLILRILVSGLFLLSAVAKVFPIWAFEKQLVDLGIVDWCLAPYLARLIIALETAIAIAILQRHYLRSLVIPITILLLLAFCTHLGIQMYQHGAMSGNCGCFGQLIPMTPLEAFIKNIVTIAMLLYIRRHVSDMPTGENKFINLLFIYTLSAFLLFFLFPFAPCKKEETKPTVTDVPLPVDSLPVIDSAGLKITVPATEQTEPIDKPIELKQDTARTKPVAAEPAGPARVQSKFAEFTDFGGKKVNLDEGKKIVCLFVPGCDHCRDAAKRIVELRKKHKLPPVYVLFMDEELFKLPEFFRETGSNFPYTVVNDIPKFFKLLGNNANTPGVFYMWNGNIIKSYEGTGTNEFKPQEMWEAINSNKY
jgi:hypothetical protein